LSVNISSLTLGESRPAQYDVRVIRNVRIPSSVPGMTLGGDLYLPGAGHAVPALVTLHTARKDAAGGIGTRRYLQYFARRGMPRSMSTGFGGWYLRGRATPDARSCRS